MAVNEQEMLEDLAYTESEGSADMLEEADSWDRFNGAEEADLFGEASDFGEDGYEAEPYEDSLEAEEADESISTILGNALGAEDEDEFLGKIWNVAKKVGKGIGKVASYAAPALKMIPHPYAQAASKVAGVLSKLKAEGASIEDALEAVSEVAAQDRRALPVVAGLVARSVLNGRGATMSPAQRKQAAKAATAATKALVAAGGAKAMRAMPKLVKSVKRTAASKGTPVAMRPRVLARTAARVAQRPDLVRNLSRPSPRGQEILQRTVGSVRTLHVPAGSTITITTG
jgi:hypothetical protein